MKGFKIKNKVLVEYEGTEANIVIPDGVRVIDAEAFSLNFNIISVKIPSGVKRIEGGHLWNRGTFYCCENLETVIMADTVKEIGSYSFSWCRSLENIVISEGTECIEQGAFLFCDSLSEIAIPSTVKKIMDRAFEDCTNLKKVVILSSELELGNNVFSGCHLSEIYAPKLCVNDMTSDVKEQYLIGFVKALNRGETFDERILTENKKYVTRQRRKLYNTESDELFLYVLQSCTVPLEDIDELLAKANETNNSTRAAALIDYREKNFTDKQKERYFNKQLEVREQPTVADLKKLWAFQKKEDGTYRITAYKGTDIDIVVPAMIGDVRVTEIGKATVANYKTGCLTNVRSIVLPDGFETIGIAAFQGSNVLEKVEIPDSLKEIRETAFMDCKKLKEVLGVGSVKKICEDAFYGCEFLEKIEFSKNLETIESRAFEKCKELKEIKIPSTVKKIGKNAFVGCVTLETIVLPDGMEAIVASMFRGCKNLDNVTIPNTVKSIDERAFSGCMNLQKIEVPANVETIGEKAFSGCDKLVDFILYDGVTEIRDKAFEKCKSLKKIEIPASVKKICRFAFTDCDGLETLALHEGTEEIEFCAFRNCKNLKKIIIPSSVIRIGGSGAIGMEYMYGGAFIGCEGLTIYCRVKEKPEGWIDCWDDGAKVVWGYEGD